MADITSLAKGRYKIVQRLGEGGMAEVFLALDTFRDIPVAIKCPLADVLEKDRKNFRFMQEVAIHGRVIHPNVVVMLDARTEVLSDGSRMPYMVLEYAPGINAYDCSGRPEEGGFGPLPPGVAGRIMLSVVGALAAMHRQGICHRDVKPANIMVGWDCVGYRSTGWDPHAVKLMDFGIAFDADDDDRRTTAKAILGSKLYMSPEQDGDAKNADHRSDIFSAGATLYALLTGQDPAVDIEVQAITEDTFALLSEPWRTIVFGATRYRRHERAYQTAEELGSAIESALRDCPDRLGPFEHWLAQKKIASPVEAALRRARGKGLTIVAEAEEPASSLSGTGHTRWFDADNVDLPEPEEVPVAPLPKSRVRYAMAAVAFAAMASLVLITAMGGNGAKDGNSAQPDTVVAVVPAVLPTPSVGSQGSAAVAPSPAVDAAPPLPSSKPRHPTGPAIPVATVAAPVVPVPVLPAPVVAPAPAADTGSVHLVKGASSIVLVGADGVAHPAGRVSAGTYQIKASFRPSSDPVNAGTVTVIAGQDLSVSCSEPMALCNAR